jgi:hypothetical protein
MGRATQIKQVLTNSGLPRCCVLNSFKDVNIRTAPDPRLSSWGGAYNAKNKGSSVGQSELNDAATYLLKGTELVKQIEWAGVCQTFACASAALIQKGCPTIQSIELFSFGTKFSGHVFLVLDRAPGSTAANPGTWGRALVVDVWYAIQQDTPDDGVYKGNSTYFTWLGGKPNIQRVLAVA